MKRKTLLWPFITHNNSIKYFFRIMKISFFLLFVCVCQLMAVGAGAQEAKVKITESSMTIRQLISEIEAQTDYLVVFRNQDIDINKIVSLKKGSLKVADCLDNVFGDTNVGWRFENNYITLVHKISEKQQARKSLKGKVCDNNGEPIIGANVVEKGTTNGTITDQDGRFSLEVQPNASVVISYIGFESQTHVVTGNVLNVVMSEDSQALNEVVVVGYGTRKAGEITGAVSTVKAGEIQKLAITNAGEALKNVAGVTTLQSNTPGAEPTILIRGIGTINDSRPLWIVDGVPDGKVNPNNIETITILKDAASQAIYGTRAANGVILVTTKSGKKNQKAHISVNLRSGFVQNTNHYKMLNTQEYGEMLWLQAKNGGIANYSHPLYGSGATPDIPDYIFPT